jgi:hypothetical protein
MFLNKNLGGHMRVDIAHVVSKVMNRQSITKVEQIALVRTVKHLAALSQEAIVK